MLGIAVRLIVIDPYSHHVKVEKMPNFDIEYSGVALIKK